SRRNHADARIRPPAQTENVTIQRRRVLAVVKPSAAECDDVTVDGRAHGGCLSCLEKPGMQNHPMSPVSGNILVVEDEQAIAETIVYALETEGFRPIWKTTGRAA